MFEPLFGPIWQWGFLVKDIDSAMRCWVEQLGVGPWWVYRDVRLQSTFQGAETEVQMHVALSYQKGVQIELIQQVNTVESPYSFFYGTQAAQTLHQLGYAVDDVKFAVRRAAAVGLREVGAINDGYSRYVYLSHPNMEGLVIELMPRIPAAMGFYRECAEQAAHWDGKDPIRNVGS